jgi:hypothetical protein
MLKWSLIGIARVQQKHQNTLVYTQLVEFKNDGLTFKTATTMQQACNQVKGESEYVTALDSKKISFKMLDLE